MNFGTINFDKAATTASSWSFQSVGAGTFVNEAGATLNVTNTEGTISDATTLKGVVTNHGHFELDYELRLNETSTGTWTHVNTGTINIDDGTSTQGALLIATENRLENVGTISGEGNIYLVDNLSLDNQGTLSPGLGGTGDIGILFTSGANIELGANSKIEIELDGFGGAGIGHDQLKSFDTLTQRGRLNLSTNFVQTAGNGFGVIAASTLLGAFDSIVGRDLSAESLIYDVSTTTGTTDTLVLTTVAATSFTAGDDTIMGTAGADAILAGDGNDDIDISVGAAGDNVFAQNGDDYIKADLAADTVDGGAGIDTVSYVNTTQDLTTGLFKGYAIENIEIWSLRDSTGTNVLTLDTDAIRAIVDGANDLTGVNNSLVVLGQADGQDKVILQGSFFENGTTILDPGTGPEEFLIFVGSDGETSLYLDKYTQLEIPSLDTKYGGSADDTLTGTDGVADSLFGRIGNDTLDYEAGDSFIDGGTGLDTILIEPNDTVDLTGVSNLLNVEVIDMTNATVNSLDIDVVDILDVVGDNQIDILGVGKDASTDGYKKIAITGDATDSVTLNGFDLTNITGNATPTGMTSDYTSFDAFGDSEMYISFIDSTNQVEVLVHEDLVDPDPVA